MVLKSIIESLLFISSRPVTLNEISKVTSRGTEEIEQAIGELIAEHAERGVIILHAGDSYMMSTNPTNTESIKNFLNAELREKLTDSSIETLAIITYKQPVTRAEIEGIRGVNSQYSIRLLLMRGLIERTTGNQNSRVNHYQTTHEFLQHIGIKSLKDLPDFEELTSKIKPPEDFTTKAPLPNQAS